MTDKAQVRSDISKYGFILEALMKHEGDGTQPPQDLVDSAKELRKGLKRVEKSLKRILSHGTDTGFFDVLSSEDDTVEEADQVTTDSFINVMSESDNGAGI